MTGPSEQTRRHVLRAWLLAAGSLTAACSPALQPAGQDRATTGRWTIAGGLPEGVYQSWAQAFAAEFDQVFPAARVEALGTAGSRVNLGLLAAGRVSLALAAVDSCAQLIDQPGGTRSPLRAVARLYDDYMHLIVRADSDLHTIGQLRGRRLACGAVGSGTALIARRVLAAAGIGDVELRTGELVGALRQLRTGDVDAVFWSGGLPTRAVAAAWQSNGLRLVALDAVGRLLRERFSGIYRMATIPAGTYANAQPVPTFAVPNLLICEPGLGPVAVRASLDVLFRHGSAIARSVPAFAVFDAATAIDTQPVPLDPEAVSYYRALKP